MLMFLSLNLIYTHKISEFLFSQDRFFILFCFLLFNVIKFWEIKVDPEGSWGRFSHWYIAVVEENFCNLLNWDIIVGQHLKDFFLEDRHNFLFFLCKF